MSRLWGKFNEIPIPVSLRPAAFKLYATIFGCNLNEMKEPDLTTYPNLASFFYRELKEGARVIDESAELVNDDFFYYIYTFFFEK